MLFLLSGTLNPPEIIIFILIFGYPLHFVRNPTSARKFSPITFRTYPWAEPTSPDQSEARPSGQNFCTSLPSGQRPVAEATSPDRRPVRSHTLRIKTLPSVCPPDQDLRT